MKKTTSRRPAGKAQSPKDICPPADAKATKSIDQTDAKAVKCIAKPDTKADTGTDAKADNVAIKAGSMFNGRPVIYQVIPRLFTNYTANPVPNGDIITNGSGKLNDINDAILQSVRQLGATHIWYTGVIEHAHCTDYTRYGIERDNPYIVKGKAGSPYAIKDWYDIDPDVAADVPSRMAEFEALVERSHRSGLRVITDFVPNHTARRYHSDAAPAGVQDFGANDNTDDFFCRDNNYYYIPRQQFSPQIPMGTGSEQYVEFPAKCTGNDCFTAYPGKNDWYETVKLNYGYDPGNGTGNYDPVQDTWRKMLDILMFWSSKGIDGFRCDMVHMVPVEFWQWVLPQIKARYPHIIFIAEIYDVSRYRDYLSRGHFDYLYDKVTLYDTLRGIDTCNVSAARLTSCWQTVEGISKNMLGFLENHDEQRYASPQYMGRPDTALAPMTAISTMSNGAVMIYMGQELGEPAKDAEGFSGLDGRTTIFDYWSLDTLRRWLDNGTASGVRLTDSEQRLRQMYARLLNLVNSETALREGAFFDLTYANYQTPGFNPHRNFAYMRKHGDELVLAVLNFDNTAADINVTIPAHALDCLHIPASGSGCYEATDLLHDNSLQLALNPDATLTVPVGAHSAALLKFVLPK